MNWFGMECSSAWVEGDGLIESTCFDTASTLENFLILVSRFVFWRFVIVYESPESFESER